MRSLTILLLLSFSVTQSVSAMDYFYRLFGFQTGEGNDQQWQVVPITEEIANNPQATYAQVVANNPQATERQQVAASVGTVTCKRKKAKKSSQSCGCSLPDHEEPRKFPKDNYRGPKAFKNIRQNLALDKRTP